MVSKSDIVNNIPASGSISEVADGDVVSAAIENFNNQALLNFVSLLYKFVRDDAAALSVTNTFTAAQIFDILQAAQIRPAVLNGDLILNPNGSGKFRYSDGSSDTEIASKGYVQGVAFTAGNVPAGGTASTYLRGDGSWQAIGLITDSTIRTSGFTAVNGTRYLCNSTSAGFTVTLPPTPTAGQRVGIIDTTGGAGTNPITIGRNGSLIMNLAEDMTISTAFAKVYLVFDTARGWVLV